MRMKPRIEIVEPHIQAPEQALVSIFCHTHQDLLVLAKMDRKFVDTKIYSGKDFYNEMRRIYEHDLSKWQEIQHFMDAHADSCSCVPALSLAMLGGADA